MLSRAGTAAAAPAGRRACPTARAPAGRGRGERRGKKKGEQGVRGEGNGQQHKKFNSGTDWMEIERSRKRRVQHADANGSLADRFALC
eukprot:361894-Chlamydomonas_euryale.AAC.4